MFEDSYGLSCIENQTLAILRERGMDIRPLYRDCAMPMKELFFFLIYHGNKQEYFDRIIRVQDLARELGVLSMELCGRQTEEEKECRPSRMIDDIRNAEKNEFILARVTEKFTKERLHARGLRDDHYVRVMAIGEDFNIINDIPEITLPLKEEDVLSAYGGDYFRLRVNCEITQADLKKAHASRVFKAENHTEFYFDPTYFEPLRRFLNEPRDVGIRIRNMTGVYKILRYRMAEYYGQYTDTGYIRERMPEIEKYYSMFEYYNLKKSIPFERYFETFYKLNQLDNEIMQELKSRLLKSYFTRNKKTEELQC